MLSGDGGLLQLSPVLAALTFGAPLLAWGLVACAVPILVHLVLRQRPRQQVFPALRLLKQSKLASTRSQRLRHLVLLASRVSVIALIVLMLMEPGCTGGESRISDRWLRGAEPVSAVICLDDSASMSYRYQGQTRLKRATEWVRMLLRDAGRFPPGSQIAVLSGTTDTSALDWTEDLSAAVRRIEEVNEGFHNRSTAALLRSAFAMIATGRHDRREVYLLTDLTQSSWRDAPPPVPEQLGALYVLDAGQPEHRNVMLGLSEARPRILPVGVPLSMQASARTGDQAAEPVIEVLLNGQPRERVTLGALAAHSRTDVDIDLPPLPEGTHEVTLELEPGDALTCDNRRYVMLSVGRLPGVLLIEDETASDLATMLGAMIAPPAQPNDRRVFDIRRIPAASFTPADQSMDALAVILAGTGPLKPQAWPTLAAYVRQGGTLIWFPGDSSTPAPKSIPAALLPAPVEAVERLSEPVTLAIVNFDHPFLGPFAEATTDSLNNRLVFQRVRFGALARDARMIAPFADGEPALLERPVGDGRVVFFGFSPIRSWSQFGTRAAPLIVLLHTLLTEIAPPPSHIDAFIAGERVVRPIEVESDQAIEIQEPGSDSSRVLKTERDRVNLPTEVPGHYRLKTGDHDGKPMLAYSVNVAAQESDPVRADPVRLVERFPAGLTVVADDPDSLGRAQRRSRSGVSVTVLAGLALLGLLLFESFLANRFYGVRASS